MTSDVDRGGLRPTRRQALKGLGMAAGGLVLGPGMAGLLASCGGGGGGTSGSTGGSGSGGTLKFGLSSYPPNLNPFVETGTAAGTVALASYRGLVGYDAKGKVASELAESWNQDSPSSYVFKLRKNAKFQNGDPVTADDVVYSFQYMTAPDSVAYWKSLGPLIGGLDAVDPHTFKLTLKQPDAAILDVLATPWAPIVSKKAAQASPAKMVGAGPFVVKTVEKGTKVTVTRFADYYKKGLPKLDGIDFIAYADDNLRVTALQSGAVDLIEYVPWQNMSSIESSGKLSLQTVDGPFMYLLFNVTRPPFNNATLRRALGYAIDRDAVMKAAFFGRGSALKGVPVQSSSPYYNAKDADFWSHDPDKAKSMIAQAGAAGLSTTLLSTSQYGMHKDTAQVVQADLSKVGINVKLDLPDWPTRVAQGNKGDFEFAVQGSAGNYNDPDFLTTFLSGTGSLNNSYGFNDPTIDGLLAQGRSTIDESKRKQIYDQLYKAMLEQAPLVTINWRSQGYAYQKSVGNFHNLPGFLTFYSAYSLDGVTLSK